MNVQEECHQNNTALMGSTYLLRAKNAFTRRLNLNPLREKGKCGCESVVVIHHNVI